VTLNGPRKRFFASGPPRPQASARALRRASLGVAACTAALVLLTACNGGPTEPSTPGTAPGTSTPSTASPGTGDTVTVDHAQGTTEVPAGPEKVFVFDLGVMDSLNALGIQPDGVPDAPYPEELQDVADGAQVRIGTLTEPDLEVIAEQDPDLIIISASTAGAYAELSGIAPTIDLSVNTSAPMESFSQNVTALGEVFDKEAEAGAALDGIESKVEAARATLKDAGNTNGLVVMTSAGEITAFGAGSRFGLVHDVLGMPSASKVKAQGQDGTPASTAFIAEADPDNLFVIDRDAALGLEGTTAQETLDDDLVTGTTAARNGKVIYLDPADWYLVGYGLDNMHRMINEVVNHVATASPTGGGLDVSDT
jgi:iron complex transport system substrate-binding protein